MKVGNDNRGSATEVMGKHYASLAVAIVMQAVADWRSLVKANVTEGVKVYIGTEQYGYDEIREFFKSDWGKNLCDHLGVPADRILWELNDEFEQHVMHNERVRKRMGL